MTKGLSAQAIQMRFAGLVALDGVTLDAPRGRITGLADRAAGELSTGHGRLVELARTLAGRPTVILLDEPSSGLDPVESSRFGTILRRVMDENDVALLLVEHDMNLVLSLCDWIYVIDFGRPIFEGTPDDVRRSPEVQAAYLGKAVA